MLPWWIKVFCWIYLLFGAAAMLQIPFALTGHSFQTAMYGLETSSPMSPVGIFLLALFALKALTAFYLLREMDAAILFAIADGMLGILICTFVMVFPIIRPDSGMHAGFRLELVLLIPYLNTMLHIKTEWEEASKKHP